jgi:hypothetical protein
MENEKPSLKALSASRIKTLENCSWLYWVTYHLKLPQIQNDGAKKGEVCHSIFELLLSPKHKEKFNQIVKIGSVAAIKSVERLIRRYLKKLELDSLDSKLFLQIDQMIMVGLKTDFFVKGGKLVAPEFKFDIINETPKYYIRGFIDKPYLTDKSVIIDDFKSSKKKFSGEDEESNVQAMIYSLAALKLWPDKTPRVRFIFLQFPDDPMMKVKFSKDSLKGFEYYLAETQEKVDSFSEKEAKRGFAFDKEDSKAGEFKGRLICGRASFLGQKKKDGTIMWHCPYKFGFKYYALKKDGTVLKSAFKKEKLQPKEGEVVEEMTYDGCPRFNNVLNTFGNTIVQEIRGKLKSVNVLDDF